MSIAAKQLRLGTHGGSDTSLEADSGGGLQLKIAASTGIKVTSSGVSVEPADIAGTGLEDDGSDALRIATAAAGNGLTGGGGSALAFDTTANLDISTGGGIHTHSPNTLQVVGTPDSANDSVNKSYVDGLVSGLAWKNPVDVMQLVGNIQVEGLVGNLAASAIEALSPSEADAYVVTTADGSGSLSTATVGDIWQYVSGGWLQIVVGSGGFVPASTYVILNESTTLIAPYAASTPGDRADFDGTSLTAASENTPTTGDAYVIDAGGGGITGTSSEGNIIEWNGSTWVDVVTNFGSYPPDGTRAVLSTQTALIGPYTDATDDGKIAEFDGTSWTGALYTTQDMDAVLVDAEGALFENTQWVFDGTVPTGAFVQFGGASPANAGAGMSASGNVFNVGDANKGVQVNADDLEIDGSEMVHADGGLEESANSWQLQVKTHTGADGAAVSTSAAGVSIDGDLVSIDETLTNITPDTSGLGADAKDLAAIILGIDNALNGVLSGTWRKEEGACGVIANANGTLVTLAHTPSDKTQILLFINGIQAELDETGTAGTGTLEWTADGTGNKTITWTPSSGTGTGTGYDLDANDRYVVKYLSSD